MCVQPRRRGVMCADSVLADTARRRRSLSKVGYEWKAYSRELLWVAVKRSNGNDLCQLASLKAALFS